MVSFRFRGTRALSRDSNYGQSKHDTCALDGNNLQQCRLKHAVTMEDVSNVQLASDMAGSRTQKPYPQELFVFCSSVGNISVSR